MKYERKIGENKYMIKAAIFDLDGTLLNTLDDLMDSANFALQKNGCEKKTREQIRLFVGNGVKLLIDRCLPDETEDVRAKVLAVFKEHYAKNMTNKTAPYPGIMDALRELKSKGFSLAIVSNKFDAAVKGLSKLYFDGIIDEAVGESAQVRKKPAPDSVLTAMKHLKCDRAVYIGDSDVDVLTAHNAGLKCIGVTWGFRDEKLLRETGADEIAHNAADMAKYIEKLTEENA